MDPFASKVRRASNNPWLVLSSMVGGFVSLLLTLFLAIWPEALKNLPYRYLIFYSLIAFTLISTCFFTILIFQMWTDTKAVKWSYSKIHEINHAYRDALARTVFPRLDEPNPAGIPAEADTVLRHAASEVDTLAIVVHKIALIYRELVGAPCMVVVKVCDKRCDSEECFAIARSEKGTGRDRCGEQKFVINAEENTAFVEARKRRPNGTSHFWSEDLPKLEAEGKYKNAREDWKRHYKSCIVVPIRYAKQTDATEGREIGYLSVDTKARYRLNSEYHVELLAAFADQMYNFLHLSRASLLKEVLRKHGLKSELPTTT